MSVLIGLVLLGLLLGLPWVVGTLIGYAWCLEAGVAAGVLAMFGLLTVIGRTAA